MTHLDLDDEPAQQFLSPELVIAQLAEEGAKRACGRTIWQVLLLSMIAGGFITIGALFSTIISTGTSNEGIQHLLEGFGFSVGFFMVILSGALLFTEINVEMPATLLESDTATIASRVFRLWILAAIGNLIGAFLIGQLVAASQTYSPDIEARLAGIVSKKLSYQQIGGFEGWGRAVLSGVLGNWLVGMAAFFATMGRSIIGKYIPVFLVVTAFVASGFLHSPANMAFFSLAEPAGLGSGWGDSLFWGILPAAVGNILGGFFLVALPFWFLSRTRP